MEFIRTSNLYSLNKSTYVNLRWIAYIGQLSAIFVVQFYLKFTFQYFICISIVLLGILTNIFLNYRIKTNQRSNMNAYKTQFPYPSWVILGI